MRDHPPVDVQLDGLLLVSVDKAGLLLVSVLNEEVDLKDT